MRLPRRDQGRGARHYYCLRDPWPAGRLLAPGPNAGSQGWCSSSDDDDNFQGNWLPWAAASQALDLVLLSATAAAR